MRKRTNPTRELIESLLKKAAGLKGLTHREAAVLLDCDLPEENEKMFRLAEQIKRISTATVSSCSRPCISPITASTAVLIAPIIIKINISAGKS